MLQFLILTTIAMYYYPGGVLHDRSTVGYNFFTNFFSDLGRTIALNRSPNTISHNLFKIALTSTGISMTIFFATLPFLFQQRRAKILGVVAMLAAFVAGACYIGIAFNPLNGHYWSHRFFVRTGFLACLLYTSPSPRDS